MPTKTSRIYTEQLVEAHIPKRYWKLDRRNYFGEPQALISVEFYAKNATQFLSAGVSLVFRGPPQSGKTFLLCYLLRCLMLQGYTVKYTTLAELTDALMRRDGQFYTDIESAQFYAIDYAAEVNEGTKAAFRQAIIKRRDNSLPLFVATSWTEQDSESDDQFLVQYGQEAKNLLEISKVVNCHVNSFRLAEYYNKLKTGKNANC